MTSRAGRAAAVLASVGLLCGGCSLLPHSAGTTPASPSPRPAPTSPRPKAPVTPLASLLPFPSARLQAAAVLAARFTGTWDSWSWRQPPAAWLAALKPMAAAELYLVLAQAAGTPGVLAQRAAARQVAVATVTSARIADLTPGSATVDVTVRQAVSSASGTSQSAASFAVTLTPAGDGWQVWDIEPADAGNS
jgi:hypothetical protein